MTRWWGYGGDLRRVGDAMVVGMACGDAVGRSDDKTVVEAVGCGDGRAVKVGVWCV